MSPAAEVLVLVFGVMSGVCLVVLAGGGIVIACCRKPESTRSSVRNPSTPYHSIQQRIESANARSKLGANKGLQVVIVNVIKTLGYRFAPMGE